MQNTEALEKQQEQREKIMKKYGSGFSGWQVLFEWGCTDMAAGKTLDGRTPRICPIYATDKLRNMGKNLEKSERRSILLQEEWQGKSVIYCCV